MARNHCYTLVPKVKVVKMAINGLDYAVRKKLVNKQFLDLSQLDDKVRQVDELRREIRKEKVAFVDYVELDERESDPKGSDVHVAELRSGLSYVCTSLKPVKRKEKANGSKPYSFNITKIKQIFDILLKDKQIVIPD